MNFYYLNAGYVGYYGNHNGADDALTMTSIQFNSSEIVFKRYDSQGTHSLKGAGKTNAYKGETGYDPNTTVYASPLTAQLTSVTDSTPLTDVIKSNVTVNTYDESGLTKDKLVGSGIQTINTFSDSGNDTKVLQFNNFSGSSSITGVKIYNPNDSNFAPFVPQKGKTYEISFKYRTYYGNYNDLYINVRGTTGTDLSGDILGNAVVIPKKDANFKDEVWREASVKVTIDKDYTGLAIAFEADGLATGTLPRWSMLDDIKVIESEPNAPSNAGVIDLVSRLSKGDVTVGTYDGTYDGSYSLTSGYKLAWTEDFTGDKLSKTWKFKDADGYDTLHNGITNGVMENAVVKEGLLNAQIYRDAKNDIYGVSIASDGAKSMAFKYGYIEGRIKLPTAKGYSAALWAVTYSGALGSGEFDIFENASQVDSVKPNLHAWLPGNHLNILGGTSSVENYGSVKLSIGENYYEKFHNFGMEWTDDYIKFYIDGKCRFTFDTTTSTDYNVFDQYANVCLCFFADEEWCKVPLADGDNENCAYVDWIRVWQKDEAGYGIKVK